MLEQSPPKAESDVPGAPEEHELRPISPVEGWKNAPVIDDPGGALRRARSGAIGLWAIIGVLWVGFCIQAMVRWVLSDDFGPAGFAGPERMPEWSFWVMRFLEIASLAWAAWMIWLYLIRPWIRDKRLGLDGMIIIGSLLTIVIDPMINYFEYTFAWNAQALNLGTWHFTFPLASDDIGVYGEGLAWAGPMYLYLGLGLSVIMTKVIFALRRRYPGISNVRSYFVATFTVFLLDCILEVIFLRAHVYAYPRTIEWLTIAPGSQYQFPVYESIFVAFFALGFCALRMSAIESKDGLSFVERGAQRFRPQMQTPTRLLAVVGFCFVCAFLSYFATWSWLSVNVDSLNPNVPSYMMPVEPSSR